MKHYKTPIHTFSIAANASTLYPRSPFNQSAPRSFKNSHILLQTHQPRPRALLRSDWSRANHVTNRLAERRAYSAPERASGKAVRYALWGSACASGGISDSRTNIWKWPATGFAALYFRKLEKLAGHFERANALVTVYNIASLWRIYTGPWAQLVVQSRTPQNFPKTFQTNFASKFSFPKILFGSLCDHSPFFEPALQGVHLEFTFGDLKALRHLVSLIS